MGQKRYYYSSSRRVLTFGGDRGIMIMTEQEIKDFIEGNEWIFAKTYAKFLPHEWIIRPKVQKKFDDFVETIREKGINAKFLKKEYTYFDFGKYYYWVMDSRTEKDFIINRASKDLYELRENGGKYYMYKKRG